MENEKIILEQVLPSEIEKRSFEDHRTGAGTVRICPKAI